MFLRKSILELGIKKSRKSLTEPLNASLNSTVDKQKYEVP